VEGGATGKLKAAMLAQLLVTGLYLFLTVTALMVFSPVEISLVPSPILYMLKAFKYKLLERPDLYFLSIWIISVFSTACTYLYLSSLGIARLFNRKSHRKWVHWVILSAYGASLLPWGEQDIEMLNQLASYQAYLFTAAIPLLLLLLSLLLRKRTDRRQHS
jgi:heme/copper-type cytochrome/quinol oxidase subunit 1